MSCLKHGFCPTLHCCPAEVSFPAQHKPALWGASVSQKNLECLQRPPFLQLDACATKKAFHTSAQCTGTRPLGCRHALAPSSLPTSRLALPPYEPQPRFYRVMPPVRMGRRSAKIATRKTAQDAKRSKQYGKLGKQIVSAVKQGGSNPGTNAMLAAALTSAKQIGAPKDLIDRNIKKALDKGQADFAEIVYEVYGLGGVGIVIEALSDNNARAAATVRDVVKKGGAKMADSGSVLFNFKRCGVLAVPSDSMDGDELLLSAMEAGADDVLEPDADAGEEEPSVFKVIATPDTYSKVRAALEESNIPINNDLSGLELLPVAFVEPDEDSFAQNETIMEKLLELDDVDAVFSNQKQ